MSCDPTVFVIDDDPTFLEALGRSLRGAGLQVATFGAAEPFLASHRPDQAGCLIVKARHCGGLPLERDGATLSGH